MLLRSTGCSFHLTTISAHYRTSLETLLACHPHQAFAAFIKHHLQFLNPKNLSDQHQGFTFTLHQFRSHVTVYTGWAFNGWTSKYLTGSTHINPIGIILKPRQTSKFHLIVGLFAPLGFSVKDDIYPFSTFSRICIHWQAISLLTKWLPVAFLA